MNTETVLTDAQIGAIIVGIYEKTDAKEIGELRLKADVVPLGRAIEQAVLQSAEVQALRKDADRYRHLRDFMRTGPRDVFGVWWLSEQGYPTTLDEALDISIKEES